MNLVIVESPIKSRTIQRFLSSDFVVKSSYGHVRDLPKKELGIDIENNFMPKYVVPISARKRLYEIKKVLPKSKKVILATDEDREGEAIAWHLTQALKIDTLKTERIVFHEITKPAIEKALQNPRGIDMNLVDAQQARRILDRLVGYKLSPFLWKKVAKGLSAGRVQSVAVRLIVEREREIENFVPQEYWTIVATLLKIKDKRLKDNEFEAILIKKDNEIIPKFGIKTKEEADKIIKDLDGSQYQVANIEQKEIKRNPLPPFTTSTLQQTAWQKFHWPAKFTMQIAQQLYESGLCTYHRTDSLNLSDLSLFAAKKFIIEKYGQKYWAGYLRKFKTKTKGAQEAHEAIRPTYPQNTPQAVSQKLEKNQAKLYDLIWRRFIACQMSQAIFDSMTVDIEAKPPLNPPLKGGMGGISSPPFEKGGMGGIYTFRTTGQTLKFDGFLKVYPIKFEEKELPPLEINEILKLIKLIPSQHFTQPPARYSEATLVKKLEELGIGRPSTYAPILSTIQERLYVKKNKEKKFVPTEMGILVNDMLVQHFPEIVDYQFTAKMEKDLDKIAAGQTKWVPVVRNFYQPFEKQLNKKYQEVEKAKTEEKTERTCPSCGGQIVIRSSRFGKFYACKNFPKCRFTEPIINSTGVLCPKCFEGEIIERKTKKGKIFYSCSKWPKCDFALWDKPTGEKCPKCGSLLILTNKERVRCSNKECDFRQK